MSQLNIFKVNIKEVGDRQLRLYNASLNYDEVNGNLNPLIFKPSKYE